MDCGAGFIYVGRAFSASTRDIELLSIQLVTSWGIDLLIIDQRYRPYWLDNHSSVLWRVDMRPVHGWQVLGLIGLFLSELLLLLLLLLLIDGNRLFEISEMLDIRRSRKWRNNAVSENMNVKNSSLDFGHNILKMFP